MKQIFIFLFTLLFLCNLHGSNRNYTPWWIEKHGDYAKTQGKHDQRVKWADEVFERVENAADKIGTRLPRLLIIATRGKPYALALPDGGIIINPTTLDICYHGANRAEGDHRLAFILGHELAHLGNDDFMHKEAFMALEKHSDNKTREKLKKDFKLPESRTKELMADKKGSLYAIMAGYDISELFREKNNFLKNWADQIGIGYSYDGYSRHPSFQKRVQFIRPQLLSVVKQVELFKVGLLLYHMGSYHDGAAVFREFSKTYPAREVFNNIGACYLNLALHHLYLKFSDHYYRFRLSTIIDYSTTAETLYTRGEEDYLNDKDISRYLNKAENYFRMAAARDQHDRVCRYNLIVALILKTEYAEAQAMCNKILKKDSQDVNAMNNKAIAFYYYGKEEDMETTQKAIQILQKAHQLEPDNFEVLYNLATLKQKRKRLAGAKLYWEKYLNLPTTPKDNFYYYVIKKLNAKSQPKPIGTNKIPKIPDGIKLGEEFSHIEEQWGKEHKREYKVGSEEDEENSGGWSIDLQTMVKDNLRVLALDGTIEIVERDVSPDESISSILKKFGLPQKIVRHSGGNFYVYEDRGFSIKEIAGKVCSYIWFEKGF